MTETLTSPSSHGGVVGPQREISRLYFVDGISIREIARRRKTTYQAVWQVIQKLKRQGWGFNDGGVAFKAPFNEVRDSFPKGSIRLHNQQFDIKILWASDAYRRKVRGGEQLDLDKAKAVLYPGKIEVYSKEGVSFWGVDPQAAMMESMVVFDRVFRRIEQLTGCVIVKVGSTNIRQCRAHFAEVGNELARHAEDSGEKIRIVARDDGLVWFVIDNSFQLHEAETVHSLTAKRDMEAAVMPFFNDLRDNAPLPVLSQIMRLLEDSMRLQREAAEVAKSNAAGLGVLVNLARAGQEGAVRPGEGEVPLGRPDYIG